MSTNANKPVSDSSTTKPPKRSLFQQWGGGMALFFSYTHGAHDLATGLLVALLLFIRQDLGLSYLQAAVLTGAYALTSGFSQVFGGWVGDRIGRKNTIAIGLGGVGLTIFTVGLLGTLGTLHYYVLLSLLIVQGVLAGCYHPSAVPALTGHFELDRRGKAIAMHMVGGSLGFLLGPLVGAPIAGRIGWHGAFMILSIPALVAVPLILTRLKLPEEITSKSAPEPGVKAKRGPDVRGLAGVFRPIIGVVGLSVVVALVIGPSMTFLPNFLNTKFENVSKEAAAMWVSVIRSGAFLGSIIGGWLADKWERTKAIFLVLILTGPVLFLIAVLPSFNPLMVVVLLLFGILMAMRESTVQPFLMDRAPPKLRATVFGIYFGFGMQGSSIIQPVAGNLMDNFGIISVFNFIGWMGVGLSGLGVFSAWRYLSSHKRVVAPDTGILPKP